MFEHKSLRGRFAAIPAPHLFSSSFKNAIGKKIDALERYLSRVQEIEKRQIESLGARSDRARIFAAVIADYRVSNYMQQSDQLFVKLWQIAKSRCSEKNISLCNDEFCHLAERLERQIAARKSNDKIFRRLPSTTHQNNESNLKMTRARPVLRYLRLMLRIPRVSVPASCQMKPKKMCMRLMTSAGSSGRY